MRWEKYIKDSPHMFHTVDRNHPYGYKKFERLRKFEPLEKNVLTDENFIKQEDDDSKMAFMPQTTENVLTTPVHPARPVIDNKIPDQEIWNFPRSMFNQPLLINDYPTNEIDTFTSKQIPSWAGKLCLE